MQELLAQPPFIPFPRLKYLDVVVLFGPAFEVHARGRAVHGHASHVPPFNGLGDIVTSTTTAATAAALASIATTTTAATFAVTAFEML